MFPPTFHLLSEWVLSMFVAIKFARMLCSLIDIIIKLISRSEFLCVCQNHCSPFVTYLICYINISFHSISFQLFFMSFTLLVSNSHCSYGQKYRNSPTFMVASNISLVIAHNRILQTTCRSTDDVYTAFNKSLPSSFLGK